MHDRSHRSARTRVFVGAMSLSLAFAAVGSGAALSQDGQDPETFSILETTESQEIPRVLQIMADGVCSAENEALPLDISFSPGNEIQQKIQLLASQDALPVMFQATQALTAVGGALQERGTILDIQQAFADLGMEDIILGGAQDVIARNYYGAQPVIPFQLNVEGIWYNKDIFEELGIEAPFETWDDMMAASETIKEAGITPITVGGGSGWPLSRWIGLAIFRALGGDAMSDVYPDRTAKLTDPEYVEAIGIIREMGEKGYFPVDFASKELPLAYNDMVTGNAAMMYMGTWFLSNVNDPEQNTVGLDRIGFMPVPAIEGGLGSIDDWPANTGGPHSINANLYGPKVQAWLKCIGEHFADAWVENTGAISGLRGSGMADAMDLPPATQEVIDIMNATTSSILWMEGNSPGAKFTEDAKSGAIQFTLGDVSAEDYMALLQSDVDAAD